ncbi:MAG: YggS family pyridoxal phosphate-dependent enzyme [Eubacteriales bacterium]|nr:YggS family pyridoxal phosphate-dependent enzyme [Eubacteriales bacterium]
MIEDTIKEIQSNISKAASVSGRDEKDITLIAVSKTYSPEHIFPAVECGVCDLGENRVQEIMEKYEKIPNVRWHLIGHLQKNKVKYIIDKVHMIHSVDSYELAQEINKRAESIGKIQKILIQVSMVGEETKFGVDPNLCLDVINKISRLNNLKVCGIMTIPPIYSDPNDTRRLFKNCKKLFDEIKAINIENVNFEHLSMGMSADYPMAIEEGATMVRLGRIIFGARDASPTK